MPLNALGRTRRFHLVSERPQTWTRTKSMAAKKSTIKRQVWNKGLEVGKRDGFKPAQVKRIRSLLADRGVPGLRDLALFSTAIDTMLHGHNLLSLVVGDVQARDGSIRSLIEVPQARGMPPVRCALDCRPMSGRNLSRLLKLWVVEAGLDPVDYGVE